MAATAQRTNGAAKAAGEAARPVGAAAKLAVIQTTVKEVEKTGRNTHQNFKYMQEHGILGVLRGLQQELNVTLDVTEVEGTFVHDGNLSQAYFRAVITDNDLGAEDPLREHSIGFTMQATDNLGWGAAKLATYAKKFGLQKLCGIPTEELPEAEAEDVTSTATGSRNGAATKISRQQATALRKALKDASPQDAAAATRFANQVKAKLQADYGVGVVDDLPAAQLDAFKAWVLEQAAKAA